MFRLLAIATLGLASTAVFGTDRPEVRAPYVEPGDCWAYRRGGNDRNETIKEYELCVTFVDKPKNTILALATVKEDGREIETSWSLDWDIRVGLSRFISPEGAKVYKFPLRVGDSYSSEYKFWDALRGPNAGKVTMRHKVVGWEDIAVPAGRFRALRIDSEGTVVRSDKIYTFNHKITVWYAPEVNRHVKVRYENPDRWNEEELTGYRLNK